MKSPILSSCIRAVPVALVCLGATAALAQAQAPLRTAVDATFAPHAMARLGGGVQGFNVDLGEELAKRLGRKIEIEGAEFSGPVPGLTTRRYDFLVAPVTVTPERAKSLLFTEGYLDTDYTFLGNKSAPVIVKLEDLKGKTLAVNKGSNYEGWARDNAEKYGFKFDVYGGNADAVQAVQSGRGGHKLARTPGGGRGGGGGGGGGAAPPTPGRAPRWWPGSPSRTQASRPATPSKPAWSGRCPSAPTTRPAATPPRTRSSA